MKDRMLMIMGISCLMIIYPIYTYDNFESLGLEECKTWNEEFLSNSSWYSYVNLSAAPDLNESQFYRGVNIENGMAEFWCYPTDIDNLTLLRTVSIIFTKEVQIDVRENTEFVLRAKSNWDPTFYSEKFAHIAMLLEGLDSNGMPISDAIITRSGTFTNLTFIHWRESLVYQYLFGLRTITRINLIIYPLELERAEFLVDYMYTTDMTYIHPIGLSFVAFALFSSLSAIVLLIETTQFMEIAPRQNGVVKRPD
jgi:hypothetical protein